MAIRDNQCIPYLKGRESTSTDIPGILLLSTHPSIDLSFFYLKKIHWMCAKEGSNLSI